MKFACLGWVESDVWDAKSKREQDAIIEECLAYAEELLRNERWLDAGAALQGTPTAKTLRWKSGKVMVTDGPFAETREQLGGIGVLEARDMDHAVALDVQTPRRPSRFSLRDSTNRRGALNRQAAAAAKVRDAEGVPSNAAEDAMKFASLGYIDGQWWNANEQGDMDAMLKECIAFDEVRHKDGQWLSGVALQGIQTAKTLRSKAGNVVVLDGPFTETKEWLGGIVVLALKDLNHAVDVLSNHPALRFGVAIEIRPIDEETTVRWEARRDRYKQGAASGGEATIA